MSSFFAPVAESVVVETDAGFAPASAAALLPPGWHALTPIPGLPGWWETVPPGGEAPVADAWTLAYALEGLPGVVRTEPSVRVLVQDEPPRSPVESFLGAAASEDPNDWSVEMVEARKAWEWSEQQGYPSGGAGVLVAHPDSGWLEHPEMDGRLVLPALDFVDPADGGRDTDGSGHGLATGSVIASPAAQPPSTRDVVGVAPRARIWPIRVTRRHVGLPSPILFSDGARRLRSALLAVAEDAPRCGVVSVSLGWFGDAALHAAVKRCVDVGAIVVAAAGNYTRIVVWPAAYPEVIACAGCDANGVVWEGSARGPAVDVTGPAEGVFRAVRGQRRLGPSSGTSYATATVAGIAALWLAHHGQARLRQLYGKRLAQAFRTVLRQSVGERPTEGGAPASGFGAGIVNARQCLETPLPAPDALEPLGPSPNDAPLAGLAAFAPGDEASLRARLAALLDIPAAGVDALLHTHGREVVSSVLTLPATRQALFGPGEPGFLTGLNTFGAEPPSPAIPLSPSARARIAALRS